MKRPLIALSCWLSAAAGLAADAPPAGPPALSPAAALVLAARHDARFQAAQASYRAESEGLAIARSRLLPEIDLSISRTHNDLDTRFGGRAQPSLDYYSGAAAVTLRQPLYRPESRARVRQARAENSRQTALLEGERGRLAVDLAAAYLDVVRAQADLAAQRSQQDAQRGALAAAQRAVPLGLGSASDRESREAKAALAGLRVLQAEARRAESLRLLERMVGQPVTRVLAPAEEGWAWPESDLGTLASWQTRARERSPDVQAAQAAVAVAREGVERARKDGWPTLDLIIARSKSTSDSYSSVNNTYLNSAIGLQLAMPLYAGGRYDAQSRQAVAQLDRAQALLEGAQREVDGLVANEHEVLTQAVQRLQAHDVVVRAAAQSLLAARQGAARGTQSGLDVLDAQAQLDSARAERTALWLQLLVASLKLNALAGDESWLSLAPLDRWLVAPVSLGARETGPTLARDVLRLRASPQMADGLASR
ncbi:MAG: TolC family protein [Ramlibacter sp.]|nr:TolC family protein [Ramlibacter sp.]